MIYKNLFNVILLLTYVHSQGWDPDKPFLPNLAEEDRVELGDYIQEQQLIYMDENIEDHIIIAFLAYKGSEEPKITFTEPSSGSNNSLGVIFKRSGSNDNWGLVITKEQDYEGKDVGFRYGFEISAAGIMRRVYLYIRNIDDEVPNVQIVTNPCRIEENKVGLADCFYIIRDADGVMNNYMKYTISGSVGVDKIFEMKNEIELREDMKEWNTVLNTLQCLDFESIALYLLEFTVTDSGGNTGTAKIVVEVIDMPDRPPVWKTIFSSQQFDEKTKQTFQVEATDGDVEVGDPINYELETDWKELFSIDKESGIITVSEIDRDKLQRQIFTFRVRAFEVPDPRWFIDQNVTIIVNDINDNEPKITVKPETVTIPENTVTKLEFQITVTDMDLGDNGTYKVSLQDSTGNGYHEAFQIVPDQGYNEGHFTISVIDSSLLDYENELWQKITIEIHSQEVFDESHSDLKPVKIFLENLNDEYPMFEKAYYEKTVLENVTKDTLIETVLATDRDIGDKVKHSLIGKSVNDLFTINETSGEIRTLVDDAFDYEKEKQVIIQIQAEDSLFDVHHRNITQLYITVEDVNDEPPRITVPTQAISIEENQKHGTVVNKDAEITATDVDTTADLVFKIFWNESFATKNGKPALKEDYENCIDVKTDKKSYDFTANAILTIDEIHANNTPDYEKFDKLYIALVVEDIDQEVEPKTDKVMITIDIEDVNDNAPEFSKDSINSPKRVTERSKSGTPVATIVATDADGPKHNKVVYSIRPSNDIIPPNWIAIDPDRGEIYVNADEEIDADGDPTVNRPPFWNLTYNVTASSADLHTETEILINVTDINDNQPQITKCDDIVRIFEASENNTDVQIIIVTDADRDEAYNTPWFRIGSSASDEVKTFFSVELRTGRVYVHYKENKVLDRDYGTESFSIPIVIGDNYDFIGGTQYIIDTSFMVILKDKNNRAPIINDEDLNLPTSENILKGEDIGSVQATDADEPNTVNTKINFAIIKIEKGEGAMKEPPPDLFGISTDNEYSTGKGEVTAQHDLQEYYGVYKVSVMMNDFGVDPTQQTNTQIVFVNVAKYNFKKPKIIYPQNDEEIYLEKEQIFGETLIQYGGKPLELFTATDEQSAKWDIKFEIDEDSDPDDVFDILPAGKSRSRLVLRSEPKDVAYTLKIIADCKCTGDEPFTDSVTIKILFISENSEPYFKVNEVTEQFPENETGIGTTVELPKAYFHKEGEEWSKITIYYEMKEDTSGCFEVGTQSAVLKLTEMLDREQQPNHTLKIVASKNPDGNNKPNETSVLTVYIEVLDENDNPPNFESSMYYGNIKPSDALNTLVLEIVATDLDIDDTMTFSMVEGSFKVDGEGIDKIKTPFKFIQEIDKYKILLNFPVRSTMNGYFLFDIKVTDAVQHSDVASVQIYIVSDFSRTAFKFGNPRSTVESKKDKITEILGKKFESICNIETIQEGTNEDGELLDSQTDVFMHFINSTNNEPIENSQIQQMSSDVEVFADLRTQFVDEGLYLLRLTDSPIEENMEEALRAWLIAVSVVLGTLCIVLLITFIAKTRSLTRRLNKLSTTQFGSQESGLNRMGIAAPNTNKHAIEGSNPVYSEEKKMPDIDTTSVGSGDSDLIGIEDNPNFEYAPEIFKENENSRFKKGL